MKLYRRKTLLSDKADFAFFTDQYSQAILSKSDEPFLLVRRSDTRMLVVTSEGRIMLCLAHGPDYCEVSYASSYLEGTRTVRGLSSEFTAKDENFIDPRLAISAIKAFFDGGGMSEYVDFRYGRTDPDLTLFPTEIRLIERVEREHREMKVTVTQELQTDMKEVCLYLDEVANDRDENIDFDDAIQIGSLCGGRMNRRREIYYFSYFADNDEVWSFEVPRTVLDGIADGSFKTLTVNASIPKTETNKQTE